MFLITGIMFALGATNYTMGTSAHPGPGYFPLILSVILSILGTLVLFKSLTIESEGGDPIGAIAWRPLIIIVAAITMFGVALPRLGLIVTIPLLIVVTSLASKKFKWRGVLLSSAALTVSSWAIFVWGLKIYIPLWPNLS